MILSGCLLSGEVWTRRAIPKVAILGKPADTKLMLFLFRRRRLRFFFLNLERNPNLPTFLWHHSSSGIIPPLYRD
jgi:hypothetical protein